MTLPWLGHGIELMALGLFGWAWLDARRRRSPLAAELCVAVIYGWLLEMLDMAIFGSYHYGRLTWWWVGEVPVYIPLLWATVVHSSMAISDRVRLPMWARPFLDGLLAVLVDLAVDAIAIRLGLWHWNIGLDEGWFGVPSGNLCAWMLVAACYGAVTRGVRVRIARGGSAWLRLAIPPVAYAGLFASLMTVGTTGNWLGLSTANERLWLFAGQVIIFGTIVTMAAARAHARRDSADADVVGQVPASLLWTRRLIHGTFFALLCANGIATEVPALAAVSVASLWLEWLAERRLDTSYGVRFMSRHTVVQTRA